MRELGKILSKYSEKGEFTFKRGDKLSDISRNVPNKAGVYVFFALKGTSINLVYIGASGTMNQDGSYSKQMLRRRLNNKQENVKRQLFFTEKLKSECLDGVLVKWAVTFDDDFKDIPVYVESCLLQAYYTEHDVLPEWNKKA